jgi:hypothetical protein
LEEMARAGSEVAAKRRSRRRGWTWSGIGEARRVESCTSVRRFELGWH